MSGESESDNVYERLLRAPKSADAQQTDKPIAETRQHIYRILDGSSYESEEYPLDVNSHAELLVATHNFLRQGETIVQLVHDLEGAGKADQSVIHQKLDNCRRRAARLGLTIDEYSVEMVRDRLNAEPYIMIGQDDSRVQSPSYTISEVSAGERKEDTVQWVANCQVHLPEPSQQAQPVVDGPTGPKDVCSEEFTASELQNRPWSIAMIEDLSYVPQEGDELIHVALLRAIESIKKEINPKRGDFQIERIIAEVPSIQRIMFPDGTERRLDRLISSRLHANLLDSFNFDNAWERIDRLHDIVMPGDDPKNPHKLIVKWWAMSADIRK